MSLGRLFWVSHAGVDTPVGGPVRDYTNPRLSPDGRLVLFNGRDGLWTLDIARGTLTRIAPPAGGFGVWIDATRIAYWVNTGVVTMRADGTGGAVPLKGTQYNDYPASVSPAGALLATVRINQATSGDVYVFPLDGSGPPRPFLATPAYEGGGQFSPDGRWMLFTSDENGAPEVAVYDIGTHDDGPYLVTELLDGKTLRARLDADRVPLSKALDPSAGAWV